MGTLVHLPDVPAIAAGDPAETRDHRALEPGTRIVCFGAGPGAEHDYGAWITEAAGTA
jgi:hypothetical protein